MNKNDYVTKEIVYAAGRDAANRSMRKAGRKVWSVDDYNVACAEIERLMPFVRCNYCIGAMEYSLAKREEKENVYAETMLRKDQLERLEGPQQ